MIEVRKYLESDCRLWDDYLMQSKNAPFLFRRRFMEYHADRFTDHSLIAFKNGHVIALLPANISGNVVESHGGLTFGGWIINSQMTSLLMRDVFDASLEFLKNQGVTELVYKPAPYIFHSMPASEDLYFLHHRGATVTQRHLSSAIKLGSRLTYSSQRKRNIKKAIKFGLEVVESNDIGKFFPILERALEKFGKSPVHTKPELDYLRNEMAGNIRLFLSVKASEVYAGTLVFESDSVAHTQYLASSQSGQQVGALDLIIDTLINDTFKDKEYLSFGISTENDGSYLNDGLVHQKEGFGARAFTHDVYKLCI